MVNGAFDWDVVATQREPRSGSARRSVPGSGSLYTVLLPPGPTRRTWLCSFRMETSKLYYQV